MPRPTVIAAALLLSVESAHAHVIAGNRFFPGTLTFDDPAVADELLVSPFSLKHLADFDNEFNVLDSAVS